ncbi:bacteriohemerythrin [Azospirillum sp. sgz301742]
MVLDWREEMNIDHGGLDSDHHEQHELIRRFVDTTGAEEHRETALDVLYTLRKHTVRHFAREERVQASIRYPHITEHQAQHARLLELLDELITQVEARESAFDFNYVKGNADQVLQFWFLDHFAKADLKLRHHLAKYTPK